MEIIESSEKDQAGLELDKIDLSDFIFPSQPSEKDKKKTRPRLSTFKPKRVGDIKVAMIIGAIVLSLIIVYLLWDKGRLDFSTIKRMIPGRSRMFSAPEPPLSDPRTPVS